MKLDKVLIVDDDPLFLGVADALIRSLGADKVFCHDRPNEALSQVMRAPEDVDLILCDLNMPDMDGIGFIRALSDRGFKGPFIIVSAEANAVIKSVEKLAEMVGINILGGLKKPLRQDDLKALLNQARVNALQAMSNVLTEKQVRAALSDGRVIPVYQPQLNLAQMKFDGIEVLCRLADKEGKLGPPGALLAAAEEHGLMTPLTFYLMRRSLSDL
ncbi:MAG: response regulator, partial [Pseudomonadota bacterium]